MNSNFDKYIQELLNSHTELPSADCWSKININLDAPQMPDFSSGASSGNVSYFSQFFGSVTGKIVSAVAAAASIGGIVSLVLFNSLDNSQQAENELVMLSEDNQDSFSGLNEETQNIDAADNSSNENKNTSGEHAVILSKTDKETVSSTETENVPIQNIEETTVSPLSHKETETTPKVESTKKTEETPKQEAKQPEKKAVVEDNKTVAVEESHETEKIQERIEPPKFFIPNIFTPNGDNDNDYFVIKDIYQFPENNLVIYRRDGKIVYEKSNYQNDWGAENISDGVYFYIFTYKYQDIQFIRKGTVTVKRQ